MDIQRDTSYAPIRVTGPALIPFSWREPHIENMRWAKLAFGIAMLGVGGAFFAITAAVQSSADAVVWWWLASGEHEHAMRICYLFGASAIINGISMLLESTVFVSQVHERMMRGNNPVRAITSCLTMSLDATAVQMVIMQSPEGWQSIFVATLTFCCMASCFNAEHIADIHENDVAPNGPKAKPWFTRMLAWLTSAVAFAAVHTMCFVTLIDWQLEPLANVKVYKWIVWAIIMACQLGSIITSWASSGMCCCNIGCSPTAVEALQLGFGISGTISTGFMTWFLADRMPTS